MIVDVNLPLIKINAVFRYNPPNETLEEFIDRGSVHALDILATHHFASEAVSGKENRWQMKESLASMQLCTDVDGALSLSENFIFPHTESALADAIATDLNTEDFDLSFTGIGFRPPLPHATFSLILTGCFDCRRQ
jgi:hypothetical protein